MLVNDLFESVHRSILPLQPTDEMIARAKDFALRKWIERHHETRGHNEHLKDDIPTDLSMACKFCSLFAQKLFGGVLRGNEKHQWLLCHDKKIDLADDAMFTRSLSDYHQKRHDRRFFGNRHHQDSLDSCMPRVEKWVEGFLGELA